jgi:hypothetical protein
VIIEEPSAAFVFIYFFLALASNRCWYKGIKAMLVRYGWMRGRADDVDVMRKKSYAAHKTTTNESHSLHPTTTTTILTKERKSNKAF